MVEVKEEEEKEEVVDREEEREEDEEDGAAAAAAGGAAFRFLEPAVGVGFGFESGWMGVRDIRCRGGREVAEVDVAARMTTLGVWGLARRFRSMYSQEMPWATQRGQGKPPLQATFLLVQ